jgi:hypothetical protein
MPAAAAVCLMLAACGAGGPNLVPAAPAGPGPIVQELSGLRISVAAGAWQGRPRSLPDRVLPLLVSVHNTGERPVSVSRGDFFLLDDANRQYLPLPPTEVVALLGSAPSGSFYPSIGIGGSTGGGDTVFGGGLGMALGGGSGGDVRDVIQQALPEGRVQPGVALTGFIYFPVPAPGYETLRFVAAPQEAPGTPRAEFPFRKVK